MDEPVLTPYDRHLCAWWRSAMGCRVSPGRLAPKSRVFTVSFLPVMYVMQSWGPGAQAVERGSGFEI